LRTFQVEAALSENLPQTEIFKADLVGENGPELQIAAFRACWEKGESYLRAVRQAAIGCAQATRGTEGHEEIESLSLVMNDLVLWFEQCNRELLELQIAATNSTEQTVH